MLQSHKCCFVPENVGTLKQNHILFICKLFFCFDQTIIFSTQFIIKVTLVWLSIVRLTKSTLSV